MKEIIRGFKLVCVGLLSAIFFYPFLHELGHSIVAILVGVEVVEFEVWPIPYVVCNMDADNRLKMMFVGMGGLVFPFVLTEMKTPKRFMAWYMWMILRGICLLSFFISILTIFRFFGGKPVEHEDMTQILTQMPEYAPVFFGIMGVLFWWGLRKIVRSRPLNRCVSYLEK